jgi:hypothetical protein
MHRRGRDDQDPGLATFNTLSAHTIVVFAGARF